MCKDTITDSRASVFLRRYLPSSFQELSHFFGVMEPAQSDRLFQNCSFFHHVLFRNLSFLFEHFLFICLHVNG